MTASKMAADGGASSSNDIVVRPPTGWQTLFVRRLEAQL